MQQKYDHHFQATREQQYWTYVLPQMFIFNIFLHRITELRRPIAVKLCHMISIWVCFIKQVLKFRALHPKDFLPKTCKIGVNFTQVQTSFANILGTSKDIQNRKDVIENDSSRDHRKKCSELWSTKYKVEHVSLDPPKSTFSGDS